MTKPPAGVNGRLGVPEPKEFKEDPVQQITVRWEFYQKGIPEKVYRGAEHPHQAQQPKPLAIGEGR